MSGRQLTTAELAQFDQGMAAASQDYAHLVEIMRRSAAEHGRLQGLGDVAAYMQHHFGRRPGDVLALLLAAIWRDSDPLADLLALPEVPDGQ